MKTNNKALQKTKHIEKKNFIQSTTHKNSSIKKAKASEKAKQYTQDLERELDQNANNVPLQEVRTGIFKSKKIHRATLKLGMQNVSDICEKAGFLLNAPQAQHIADYLFLLQKWNQSMNLVGKNSWQDVLSELVLDSLHLAKFLEEKPRIKQNSLHSFANTIDTGRKNSSKKYVFNSPTQFFDDLYGFGNEIASNEITEVETNKQAVGSGLSRIQTKNSCFETWDLGAGAGLPGIPLRILWNLGTYHMVDVREKRCFFLNTALTSLGLKNTHVYHGKAEDFMQVKAQNHNFADLIVSRAFMPFAKMLPFVAPYLRKTDQENKVKASIIFLTLEELDANKYNTQANQSEYSWETKEIYPYFINKKQKFLCEVCLV